MSNTINSNEMLLSRFVSSLSCTWNSNNDNMEGAAGSAAEDINVRTISYPSFSMSVDGDHHHHHQQQLQQRQSSSFSVSSSSSSGKEDVQSKISNMMSRKELYEAAESSKSEKDQDRYHHQQQQQPGRMMLENISDSFDQLVDARIRAYAQMLSNHVQVLRSSNNNNNNNNNERGALIAEFKLRTLLEFASTSSDDDAVFDSMTTKFKVISDDIVSTTAATSTEKEEEKLLLRATIDDDDDDDDESSSENYNKDKATNTTTLPIEMIVEICSHRFRLQQEEYQEQGFEEKLIFKTTGKMHGKRFLIGSSDDTTVRDYICLSQDGHESCHEKHSASGATSCRHSILRNNANGNNNSAAAAIAQPQARLIEVFENAQHNHNIEIDINCEELLSQMIEEAGKVVTMIVELTNLAWTTNTKKQQEIDNIIELNNMTQANVIADDDDDSPSAEIYIPPPPTAGSKRRRPRSDSLDDALMGPPRNVDIDVNHHRRHVSELPFHRSSGGSTLPLLPVFSEEESVVDVTTPPPSSSSTAITTTTTTTFTNLDVVHRDTERKRKSRDFVSIDHSFETSTFSELDDEHYEEHHYHHRHEQHEGEDALSPLPEEDSKNNNNDVDVEYYKIAAERACDIVDFVFAGEEIYKSIDVPTTATAVPSASPFSNKRLCVTK